MSDCVGLVGIGIMGSAMAANLLEDGFEVTGFDVDASRTAMLDAAGGAVAESPRAAAACADVVITSLPSDAALEVVCAGPDGIVHAARAGLTVMEIGRAHV